MDKQQAYISALELAIRALDSAFVRANGAEVLHSSHSIAQRWQLNDDERARVEQADVVAYDVDLDHWGARLALMSAFESLHAALRVVASGSAHYNPQASAWRDAASRAQEAARLAGASAQVFQEALRMPARAQQAAQAAPAPQARPVYDPA